MRLALAAGTLATAGLFVWLGRDASCGSCARRARRRRRSRTGKPRRVTGIPLPQRAKSILEVTGMMDGMGWMMGGMGLIWILILVVLALAAAALIKHLRR